MNRLFSNFIRVLSFLVLWTIMSIFAVCSAAPAITVFNAKKIITMDPMQPQADAVAVKEGKIFAVGKWSDMKTWMKPGSYTLNNQFVNDVITPGFIEAHAHFTMLSIFMTQPYVGYWEFPGFAGTTLPASKTKADVMNRLREANKKMTDPATVLFAWGYDPIYFNNQDLTASDLDQISTTRPIFVLNASEHIGYANSVLLKKVGYNAKTTIPGVKKDATGAPTGVLEEMAAAGPVIMSFYNQLFNEASFAKAIYGTADIAHRLGITTVADLLFGGPGENIMLSVMQKAANDAKYPVRMILIYAGPLLALREKQAPGTGVSFLKNLMQQNSNKLRIAGVKFVVDGSIQGFTARLNWPGYFNGAPNGIVNTTTDELKTQALPFWQAGFPLHVHVNGDEATDSALDALEYLQNTAPRRTGLYVLEHDQMSSPAQFKRTHELGAIVNLFANHIYYWGDQHYAILLGPDRANHMDNAVEAARQGIIYSLHTDSPVTPLGPLHSMWAAMNRVTASGRVLGEAARINAEDALRAVTLNAAYMHNLQNEVGSIEVGKRADFTVLSRDPLTEPMMTVKDIPVIATIQDGNVYSIQ